MVTQVRLSDVQGNAHAQRFFQWPGFLTQCHLNCRGTEFGRCNLVAYHISAELLELLGRENVGEVELDRLLELLVGA